MIRLYNTLTRRKEDFSPLDPNNVKMYVCGPTVYSDAHLGHAMSAIVFDVIRRYLEYRGYHVKFVMNFTDVDDKIIDRAHQMGIDPFILGENLIRDFRQHLDDLNILPATSNPRATQTIDKILTMIQGLIDNGYAYVASGDVYFRVNNDKDYGKLSGRKLKDMQAGARIEVGEHKEHPMDFALWKAAKPGEPAWDSPWGKGRPGWHIECSAMNLHELGEQIDIHGGGNDLIFPHHENEIAQTETYTGKPFARYWLHNGMLQLGSERMSKSTGNLITIKDFLEKRSGDVIRMLVLNGSYRAPLVFNDKVLDSVEQGLARIKSGLRPSSYAAMGASSETISTLNAQIEKTEQAFTDSMDDDFNTSGALSHLFELVRVINISRDAGAADEQLLPAQESLRKLSSVLGLRLAEKTGRGGADKFIDLLVEVRNEARKQKLWAFSDLIRDRLKELGIMSEDRKDQTTWKWG